MKKHSRTKKEMKMKNESQNPENDELLESEDPKNKEVRNEQDKTVQEQDAAEDVVPSVPELQAKIDELNDKYLRLYSEFDNYRKRTIKEKIDLSKYASEQIILELLPVLDDFERAMVAAREDENCEHFKEGVSLIYNKFKSILEKKGLKPIESIGAEFDTDFHEAVTYIPSPSDDLKGKVIDEITKGYLLQDKVIRYTKAVIGQ